MDSSMMPFADASNFKEREEYRRFVITVAFI